MKQPYTALLSHDERLSAIKIGASLKLIGDGLDKQADVATAVSNMFTGSGKALLYASLLTGIPAGVLWHTMGRAASGARRKEREVEEETRFYGDAANQLESGLAGQ